MVEISNPEEPSARRCMAGILPCRSMLRATRGNGVSGIGSDVMLRAGIVGLPNVGKSTLFNAVTRTRKAEAANYPFCTIDPNVGIVTVPDARLAVLQKIAKTERRHPGGDRVRRHRRPGQGREPGRGPRQQVPHATSARSTPSSRWCAASTTRTSTTSSGTVDPVRDIEVINTELMLADLESVQEAARARRQGHQARRQGGGGRGRGAREDRAALDAGKPALTRGADAGGEGDRRGSSSCSPTSRRSSRAT